MKPRLFVGSSTENLQVAYAIQEELDPDAEVTVWTQGVFELSKSNLESLLGELPAYDFGVFVFCAEDVTVMRGQEKRTVRDNVVFELGLFVASLGRERTYIVVPRSREDMHLPTDLLGMTPATFEPERQDRNSRAAVGPACNMIRKQISQLGPRSRPLAAEPASVGPGPTPPAAMDEQDIRGSLISWMGNRPEEKNRQLMYFADVDREAGVPEGSAKKYLKTVAKRRYYEVETEGAITILFRKMTLSAKRRVHYLDGR